MRRMRNLKIHTGYSVFKIAISLYVFSGMAAESPCTILVNQIGEIFEPIAAENFWSKDFRPEWATSHKVESRHTAIGQIELIIDNTIRSNQSKGISKQEYLNSFLENQMPLADPWVHLPLERKTEFNGVATQTTPYDQGLKVTLNKGEKVFLVVETPDSTRTQFHRAFVGWGSNEYFWPPKTFNLVEGRVSNLGEIVGVGEFENQILVGRESTHIGRVEAILKPGDQLELNFESESATYNRSFWERQRKQDPAKSMESFGPGKVSEHSPTQQTAIIRENGRIENNGAFLWGLNKSPFRNIDSLKVDGQSVIRERSSEWK